MSDTLSQYDPIFQSAGQEWNVDPRLLKAMAAQESAGKPQATSKDGAQGVMQIMPGTQKGLGVIDPTDPVQSIYGGAKYMNEALGAEQNPQAALMYYHGGPDWRDKVGPESAGYVPAVTAHYQQLAQATPQPAPGRSADADMAAQWGVAPPGAAKASAAPARPSDDDLAKTWGVGPATPPTNDNTPTVTVTAKAPAAAAPTVPPATVAPPAQPDYTGWDQPTAAASAALNYGTIAPGNTANPLSYQSLTSALAPAPNTTYGNVLPIARDNTTGALRPALPQAWRGLAQGAVDLAYGPTLGTVTPNATAALGSVAGSLMPSPAAGTGAALANPLAAPQQPLLSAEFRANPGITTPQFTPAEPAPVMANPNPLAPPQAAGNPLRTGAPIPQSGPAAPAAMSPEDAAIYNAIPDALPPAPALPPLTQSAANARADQLIQHFAAKNEVPAPQDLVPGFTPTLAQMTNDPGIATLERGVQSANPAPFGLLQQRNQNAILDFTHQLTGTPEDAAEAEAARDAATAPLRDTAFANKQPVDASPVQDMINGILAGPDGKRTAVTSSLGKVLNSLHVGGDLDAPLETDPEMLYGVRKNINDLLTPAAQRANPELQSAARQLSQVKGALDDTIESGAPGFQNYIDAYSEQSAPIDAMRYLQGLNLTDAAGNVRLQAVDTAIKGIQRQQSLPGVQKASSVNEDQLTALNTLRNTLRAQQFSATAGKPVNSATFQNLATNSRVGSVTGNPLVSGVSAYGGSMLGGPIGAATGSVLNYGAHKILGNAESMVSQAIVQRLLNLGGKGVSALQGNAGQ